MAHADFELFFRIPSKLQQPPRRIINLAALHVNHHFNRVGTVAFWEVNEFRFTRPDTLLRFAEGVKARKVENYIHKLHLNVRIRYSHLRRRSNVLPDIRTHFPRLKSVTIHFNKVYFRADRAREQGKYADGLWPDNPEIRQNFMTMKEWFREHLQGMVLTVKGLQHEENFYRDTLLQLEPKRTGQINTQIIEVENS